LKQLALPEQCDDWLAAAHTKRVTLPAETSGYFLTIFNYSFAEIAFSDEHAKRLRTRTQFEFLDSNRMILQLVFVPAELLGTDGVLLLERLDSFHDAV
jgi:hypothetical protein